MYALISHRLKLFFLSYCSNLFQCTLSQKSKRIPEEVSNSSNSFGIINYSHNFYAVKEMGTYFKIEMQSHKESEPLNSCML